APRRPCPSLADACRVSADFLVVRTLPGSLRDFYRVAEGLPLPPLASVRLLSRVGPREEESTLSLFDQSLAKLLQFDVDSSRGFRTRAAVELPRAGWRRASKGERNGVSRKPVRFLQYKRDRLAN